MSGISKDKMELNTKLSFSSISLETGKMFLRTWIYLEHRETWTIGGAEGRTLRSLKWHAIREYSRLNGRIELKMKKFSLDKKKKFEGISEEV